MKKLLPFFLVLLGLCFLFTDIPLLAGFFVLVGVAIFY